jgi:hypothetical protein
VFAIQIVDTSGGDTKAMASGKKIHHCTAWFFSWCSHILGQQERNSCWPRSSCRQTQALPPWIKAEVPLCRAWQAMCHSQGRKSPSPH